jgi:hypothetical protein
MKETGLRVRRSSTSAEARIIIDSVSAAKRQNPRVFNRVAHGLDPLHKLDDLIVWGAPDCYLDVTRLDGDPVVTDGLKSWQQLPPG